MPPIASLVLVAAHFPTCSVFTRPSSQACPRFSMMRTVDVPCTMNRDTNWPLTRALCGPVPLPKGMAVVPIHTGDECIGALQHVPRTLESVDVADLCSSGRLGATLRTVRHKSTNVTFAAQEIHLTGPGHTTQVLQELQRWYGDETPPHISAFKGAYSFEGSVCVLLEPVDGTLMDLYEHHYEVCGG